VLNGKKIVVVLPAYNAAKTLQRTHLEIPANIVDSIILVDDCSADDTVKIAKELNIDTVVHSENKGYGGNQKTCYREAIKKGADIVIMLHPDYQYSPKLLAAMAAMIAYGEYDAVLGSRILAQNAMARGMPFYKYFSNRVLTFIQNILLNQKLSEYHTGYRGFRREILEQLPLEENSDDFVFDNEMLAQIIFFDFKIGEISCPTRYEASSSSISFARSVKYGLGVLDVSLKFFLQKRFEMHSKIFDSKGQRLTVIN